jgi:copper chaperone CopZ
MTHTYNITGMTCNGCVTKVKDELLKLGDVAETEVKLTTPQAKNNHAKTYPLTAHSKSVRQSR